MSTLYIAHYIDITAIVIFSYSYENYSVILDQAYLYAIYAQLHDIVYYATRML